MKRLMIYLGLGIFLTTILLGKPGLIRAEDKSSIPSGQNIPKLPVTPDDPKLLNGHVYPSWGPVCQRYTYSVIYIDEKGRAPEYVKIYFNGKMLDMEKSDPGANDFVAGVKYFFQNVPNKLGSNFYFFEASNGLGKTRSNIIESPDNGPVLFESAFDKNEIAVVEVKTGEKILSYKTNEEWVGGVALSDDGRYLTAKTNKQIYLFDTQKPNEPVWTYQGAEERPGDVKGGVDISGDGTRIAASIGGKAILFDNQSSEPIWIYQGSGNQAYNVAISRDGQYLAMGTAGEEKNPETNLLIFWSAASATPLWQYHAAGNFHDVSLSDDGSFITGATGCPDRRFYLFAKNSNEPLLRSEMLTRDSPVHRAKISGDGQYAAVGSESDAGAVFLFSKDSPAPQWKFATPGRKSVRALNFTPSGEYIGAATFGGDVYIFERSANTPTAHWQVKAALGGIDIADDGSFVAAGGTDNKLHIFKKDGGKALSIDFEEYIEEVDIAANGKYVAVGTGGSVYFFETFADETKIANCREIIEPRPESELAGQRQAGINLEPLRIEETKMVWPGMIFGFVFMGSSGTLLGYLLAVRFNLMAKLKIRKEIKAVLAPTKPKKWLVITLGGIAAIFFGLTILAMVMNGRIRQAQDGEENLPERGTENNASEEKICGNGLCEPDFGETKGNCPDDCGF